MNFQTSVADADAAEKELAQAKANLALAQASKDTIDLKQQQLRALQEVRRAATAQLAEAQANIEEREIHAPVDDARFFQEPLRSAMLSTPVRPFS